MSDSLSELDVLAVFSHPDDAELSVSGTLLKLKSQGYRTGVLDMTRGEMGTRGTPEMREEEATEAARILKLDVRVNLGQPDGHIWPTEAVRAAVVRVLRAHAPKVVLTTHWDDPHPTTPTPAALFVRLQGWRPWRATTKRNNKRPFECRRSCTRFFATRGPIVYCGCLGIC